MLLSSALAAPLPLSSCDRQFLGRAFQQTGAAVMKVTHSKPSRADACLHFRPGNPDCQMLYLGRICHALRRPTLLPWPRYFRSASDASLSDASSLKVDVEARSDVRNLLHICSILILACYLVYWFSVVSIRSRIPGYRTHGAGSIIRTKSSTSPAFSDRRYT